MRQQNSSTQTKKGMAWRETLSMDWNNHSPQSSKI